MDQNQQSELIALGVHAAGPLRMYRNADGAMVPEADEAYLERVMNLAARLYSATVARGEDRNGKPRRSRFEELIPKVVGMLSLSGVLLRIMPSDNGMKYDLEFLPIAGQAAGKLIDPNQTITPSKPRVYYPVEEKRPGFVPATEVWHADVWIRSADGDVFHDAATEYLGRAVRYEAYRDETISDAIGGYRVFHQFVGETVLPEELEEFVERALRWRKVNVAAA